MIEKLSASLFNLPTNEVENDLENTAHDQASAAVDSLSQPLDDNSTTAGSQDLKKRKNFLQYQMKSLKDKTDQYAVKLRRAKQGLQIIEAKKGHFSPHNVRRREARLRKKIEEKDASCIELREQVNQLTAQSELERKTRQGLERKLATKRKLKWWYKNKLSKVAAPKVDADKDQQALKSIIKEKNMEIHYLQDENNQLKEGRVLNTVSEQGVYTESVRECVVDLISHEVPSNLVGSVMESVGSHLYGSTPGQVTVPQR